MTLPAFFRSFGMVVSVVLAGCSDNRDTVPVDTFAVQVEARAGVPFPQPGPVVALVAPESAASGTPIPLTLQARNETSAPLDLYLSGRDVTFDIVISDASGDAVWSRLQGQTTQAILQLNTLAPGEVFEVGYTWDQRSQRGAPVPAGSYTIRGIFLTDGQARLESAPVTIAITPN